MSQDLKLYLVTERFLLFRYDSRNRNQIRGEHWVDSSLDRSRVQFQPDAHPAHLRVTAVERADQRLYRCRVDFLHSPTRNSRVNLTVIGECRYCHAGV